MSFLKLESFEALNAVSMDSSIYRNGQSLVRGACGSRSTQPASQTDAFRLKFIVLRQILFNFITPLLSPKILCRRAATILPSISLAPTHSLSLPPRTNNKIRNMVSRDTPRGRMEYHIVQGYLSRRNCVCLTDTGIVKIS